MLTILHNRSTVLKIPILEFHLVDTSKVVLVASWANPLLLPILRLKRSMVRLFTCFVVALELIIPCSVNLGTWL